MILRRQLISTALITSLVSCLLGVGLGWVDDGSEVPFKRGDWVLRPCETPLVDREFEKVIGTADREPLCSNDYPGDARAPELSATSA